MCQGHCQSRPIYNYIHTKTVRRNQLNEQRWLDPLIPLALSRTFHALLGLMHDSGTPSRKQSYNICATGIMVLSATTQQEVWYKVLSRLPKIMCSMVESYVNGRKTVRVTSDRGISFSTGDLCRTFKVTAK